MRWYNGKLRTDLEIAMIKGSGYTMDAQWFRAFDEIWIITESLDYPGVKTAFVKESPAPAQE